MKFFTDEQFQQLLKNGSNPGEDHKPVVKLFTPFANCTWLLTEVDPENPDLAFGLCDLGMGFPELGYVYLPEISETCTELRLLIECDKYFDPKFPISVYATAASRLRRITEDEKDLIGSRSPSGTKPSTGV